MAYTLDPKFKLSEAVWSDADEVFRVLELAYKDDATWVPARGTVSDEDVHSWFMNTLAPRWFFPDITVYKITEVSSGRIAGWTGLQFPWKDRPLDDVRKAMVTSHDLPPLVEGMNKEAVIDFIGAISFAHEHGYDENNDYHRKGTMIHPDFQKRGFGTVLTKHCNAISDKTGGRTFVPARPTSIKMFHDNGYVTIGEHDAHIERWGGPRDKSITWMVIREAPVA